MGSSSKAFAHKIAYEKAKFIVSASDLNQRVYISDEDIITHTNNYFVENSDRLQALTNQFDDLPDAAQIEVLGLVNKYYRMHVRTLVWGLFSGIKRNRATIKRFASFWLPKENREYILGDLEEEYLDQVVLLGEKAAIRWYKKEILFAIFNSLFDWVLKKLAFYKACRKKMSGD